MRSRGKGLPRLVFFTDPVRVPDPARTAARLPRGAGVVYRPFGSPNAFVEGRRLAGVARRRGLILLVGADAGLAAAVGAHGVHLPERMAGAAKALRRSRPRWLITAAAHSRAALVGARRSGADAAVVSPVFPSLSPSAGAPIGAVRFAALLRAAGLPVYALGGVTGENAKRLLSAGVAGFAAVDALVGSTEAEA